MLSCGEMKVANVYSPRWADRVGFASLVFIHLSFKIPELLKSDSGYLWFAQHESWSLKDQILTTVSLFRNREQTGRLLLCSCGFRLQWLPAFLIAPLVKSCTSAQHYPFASAVFQAGVMVPSSCWEPCCLWIWSIRMGQHCFPAGLELRVIITTLGVVTSGVAEQCANI